MTIKELIKQLSKFDDTLRVCYVSEEDGSHDEVAEIREEKDYGGTDIIVLAREGCFG